jgi:transposase
MEKDAKNQAERIFLKAMGKISNVEIAKKVGAHPLTVGKWKRQDDWTGKLAQAQVKGPEKTRKTSVRKKGARDEAFKSYVEAGGKISNKALADQVGASSASIANWKAAESWDEKLKKEPKAEPQAAETETAEAVVEAPPVQELAEEEVTEIEIDVDALACPDHINVLNKQIDEILGRGHLSPIELKTVAEAKEAVLRVIIAYLEVVEMTAEE